MCIRDRAAAGSSAANGGNLILGGGAKDGGGTDGTVTIKSGATSVLTAASASSTSTFDVSAQAAVVNVLAGNAAALLFKDSAVSFITLDRTTS